MLSLSVAPAEQPDADLRRFLQALYHDSRGYARDARFAAAFIDLNGDGDDEAVVRVSGSNLCGSGGCHTHILARAATGWVEVTNLTITWPPVRVLETRSNGWRDLSVRVAGGGIIPGYEARLRFDGTGYPANPSVAPADPLPAETQGRTLIARADEGVPLFD